jgi:hypothetical protein
MNLRPRLRTSASHPLFVVLINLALSIVATRCAMADEAHTSPSLYQYIGMHIDATTGRVSPESMTLPDEPVTRQFSRLRWVPGALEGLGTRHMQWDGSAKASQAMTLLEQYAGGDNSAEPALYEMLRADDVVTFYNDTLDYASARIRDAEPRLHDLARRLATESTDRGPVKFGIAMLGSMGDESDLAIVRRLALHDEFGLYAAGAIAELAPDRQESLYQLATHVSGWGRIEAVTLMTSTPDVKLRRWLLTQAFRNDVTPQYLAFHCATIGNLEGALRGELSPASTNASSNDIELLAGIADLLQSLIRPAPSKDSRLYEGTSRAAIAFLQQVQKRRESLSFLLTAQMLKEYAPQSAWSAEEKASVETLVAPIINDKTWRKRVTSTLGDDRANLTQAELVAHGLDIETFDIHLRRLEKNGAVAERWRLAFAAADQRQLAALMNAADKTFGPRFAQGAVGRMKTSDEALEMVLQSVGKLPGVGIAIVDGSLLDLSPRVRRAAVETLVRWGGAYLLEASIRTALATAVKDETDEVLKARMVALLNVGTLQ